MAVQRRTQKTEDLNLVPIMNLVTILIPFLIMAAQFVQLAVIDSTLPAIGAPTPPDEKPDKPPLSLSLAITDRGVTVMGADAVLFPEGAPEVAEGEDRPPTIPCNSGGICTSVEDYDWVKLTAKLNLVKDEYPDEEDANVILVPDNQINYEVIVQTMDASRNDPTKPGGDGKARLLFPNVVIAGGAM